MAGAKGRLWPSGRFKDVLASCVQIRRPRVSILTKTETSGALPTDLTIEAFFDWLERQDRRFELVEGSARMLPYVKRSHSVIAGNVAFALQTQLDRAFYRVHQGDFAIETGPTSIRYADVLVEPAGGRKGDRKTRSAIVIVEVLSDSTAPDDFGPKRHEYQSLERLESYIVIDQDVRRIWQWERLQDGTWPQQAKIIEAGSVDIPSLKCSLALDEIYFDAIDAGPSREN